MADDEGIENETELSAADEADLDELPSKKLSGKKLVLFVVAKYFVVVCLGPSVSRGKCEMVHFRWLVGSHNF